MSRKLKILHLGKFFPPDFGGIETVTEAILEDHTRIGHSVSVICFAKQESSLKYAELEDLPVLRYNQLFKFKSQPISVRYLFAGLSKVGSYDLVHIHAPNLLASLISVFIPKRVRVLVHWHADIEGKGLVGVMFRPLERAMLKRADAIVCTSKNYADASDSLRRFQKKVSIIPIGIENDTYAMHEPERGSDDTVLFVGRLVPYKGVDVLLRAIRAMSLRVSAVIVGEGDEKEYLERLANDLDISDRVTFKGRVEQSELKKLYKTSTVFCLPSINRKEAFGVVLLEAMRAKLPTISSDIAGSGVPWVNASGLKFPVGDHDALADVMDSFFANPELRVKYSERAYGNYQSRFRRSQMSENFLQMYLSLLSPNSQEQSEVEID